MRHINQDDDMDITLKILATLIIVAIVLSIFIKLVHAEELCDIQEMKNFCQNNPRLEKLSAKQIHHIIFCNNQNYADNWSGVMTKTSEKVKDGLTKTELNDFCNAVAADYPLTTVKQDFK